MKLKSSVGWFCTSSMDFQEKSDWKLSIYSDFGQFKHDANLGLRERKNLSP
jgi:hypothetical protein